MTNDTGGILTLTLVTPEGERVPVEVLSDDTSVQELIDDAIATLELRKNDRTGYPIPYSLLLARTGLILDPSKTFAETAAIDGDDIILSDPGMKLVIYRCRHSEELPDLTAFESDFQNLLLFAVGEGRDLRIEY
jgi:hypothetical protein